MLTTAAVPHLSVCLAVPALLPVLLLPASLSARSIMVCPMDVTSHTAPSSSCPPVDLAMHPSLYTAAATPPAAGAACWGYP